MSGLSADLSEPSLGKSYKLRTIDVDIQYPCFMSYVNTSFKAVLSNNQSFLQLLRLPDTP